MRGRAGHGGGSTEGRAGGGGYLRSSAIISSHDNSLKWSSLPLNFSAACVTLRLRRPRARFPQYTSSEPYVRSEATTSASSSSAPPFDERALRRNAQALLPAVDGREAEPVPGRAAPVPGREPKPSAAVRGRMLLLAVPGRPPPPPPAPPTWTDMLAVVGLRELPPEEAVVGRWPPDPPEPGR